MLKLPVKGKAGLVVTIAVLIIFLVALPAARWFLAVSVLLGGIVAIILRLINRN